MEKTKVLYDGNCFLCQQSKRWINKIDWLNKLSWVSLQDYEQQHSLEPEEKKAIQSEIHVFTPGGKVLVGYEAMRFIFLHCPITFIGALFMYIPKTGVVGKPLYRLIAKNRYRIFKSRCKDGSCSIH